MDSGSRQKEKLSVDADFVCVFAKGHARGCESRFLRVAGWAGRLISVPSLEGSEEPILDAEVWSTVDTECI